MNGLLSLLIVSCSVAADATAVAIAAAVRGVTLRRGLTMAAAFGAAQALMAGVGWFGGAAIGRLWSAWDHWIALALLSGVGLKMIREAFASDEDRGSSVESFSALVVLSIATSLDALAVGVTLPALGIGPFVSLAMIGFVTLLFSAAGSAFGRLLGQRFGRMMEVTGGLALIAIGVKIVHDHLQ
jgi:putative Mn2+ efflux pump MntP